MEHPLIESGAAATVSYLRGDAGRRPGESPLFSEG